MQTKKERRAAKRRKKKKSKSMSPSFQGCDRLTEAEYEEFWDKKQDKPFAWSLPRENFVGDLCKAGPGMWPTYYDVDGIRNGERVKMRIAIGTGRGCRYFRFVQVELDVSP